MGAVSSLLLFGGGRSSGTDGKFRGEEAAETQPLSPESSDPSCLHCPAGGEGRLNWPREGGQRKGRGEGSEPDTWKCLLAKVKVIPRDVNQAAYDAADSDPSCSRWENGGERQSKGQGWVLGPGTGTFSCCPTRPPSPLCNLPSLSSSSSPPPAGQRPRRKGCAYSF